MKKLLGLTFSMLLALPVIAMAQNPSSQSPSSQTPSTTSPSASQPGYPQSGSQGTMGENTKSNTVKGTVSQDGKTLVGDDGKSWTIENPEAVKGHEGHHVELKGSADAATNQIQVSSVKVMKGDKSSKKDASQQPQ